MSVVTGVKEAIERYNVLLSAVIDGSKKGLDESAQEILSTSISLTPKDTGNLISSSYYVSQKGTSVNSVSFNNDRKDEARLSNDLSSAISYNKSLVDRTKEPFAIVGYSAYYSNIIHEINNNYTVGQWKFLETAVKQHTSGITKKVGNAVLSELNSK